LISGELAIAFSEVAALALTPTVPMLETFARAVAELHSIHSTIPFRFGIAVESDHELETLLCDHRSAWLSILDRVEQCDEYSVHLQPHPESSTHHDRTERTAGEPEIIEPTDRPGTNYMMGRRNAAQRALAVRKPLLSRAEQVRQALDGLYRDYEINPPMPGKETLVTLVFLVARASAPAFLSTLKAACCATSDHIFQTGPWPPYHFTASLSDHESSARLRRSVLD